MACRRCQGTSSYYRRAITRRFLGRLATQVSAVLMGKHKPTYNPSDPECGDYVVVVNAGDIVYSKKTYEKKVYRWYTGWPGGLKERTLKVFATRFV